MEDFVHLSLCVYSTAFACVHRERGGCLPTIASPPLIVCQGFDEESHCTSFLHDNSPHTHTHTRTCVCILLFLCFYTHTHTRVAILQLICLLALPLCIDLFHKACYMTEGVSQEAARKKALARLQVLFFSIGGSPPRCPPPCTELSHLGTRWPRLGLHRCRLWRGRPGNVLHKPRIYSFL